MLNDMILLAKQKFGMTLDELKGLNRKTVEQKDFLKTFYHFSPVIESDCVMNRICKYIESIDFGIKRMVKADNDQSHIRKLMSRNLENIDDNTYQKVVKVYEEYKKTVSRKSSLVGKSDKGGFDDETYTSILYHYNQFEKTLFEVSQDIREIVDCLIYMFYIENPKSNKDVLWNVFGDYIYENIINKVNHYFVPVEDSNGEIDYLGTKYSLKKVVNNNV